MRLVVRTLGAFEVRDGSGALLFGASGRAKHTLFKYLVATPGLRAGAATVRADLWPGAKAQGENLRWAIFKLRETLQTFDAGNLFTVDDDTKVLSLASERCEVDAHAFETRIRSALRAGPVIELERILAEYRGPFLPLDYDNWALRKREELEGLVREGLARILRGDENATPRAIGERIESMALAFARSAPDDRDLATALLEYYFVTGDRTAAQRLRGIVDQEAETATELDAILARFGASNTTATPRSTRDSAYVGRTVELERVAAILARVASGAGAAICTFGSSGIGKTAFARAALRAASPDTIVLTTPCRGTALEDWFPHIDALLASLPGPPSSAGLASAAQALAGHVPALARWYPHLEPLPPLAPPLELARLASAIAKLVCALAETSPVVWVIDDVDEAGSELVRAVSAALGPARRCALLVFMTASRFDFLAAPAAHLFDDDREAPQVIDLEPLRAAQARHLASIRGVADETRAKEIIARSQGFPARIVAFAAGDAPPVEADLARAFARATPSERALLCAVVAARPAPLGRDVGGARDAAIDRWIAYDVLEETPDGIAFARDGAAETIATLCASLSGGRPQKSFAPRGV